MDQRWPSESLLKTFQIDSYGKAMWMARTEDISEWLSLGWLFWACLGSERPPEGLSNILWEVLGGLLESFKRLEGV